MNNLKLYTIYKADGSKQDLGVRPEMSLEEMQAIVGGLIQLVPAPFWEGQLELSGRVIVYANEEGKLQELPINPHFQPTSWGDFLVGDVLVEQPAKAALRHGAVVAFLQDVGATELIFVDEQTAQLRAQQNLNIAKHSYWMAKRASEDAWRQQVIQVDVHEALVTTGEISHEEYARRCAVDIATAEELSRTSSQRYDELQKAYGEYYVAMGIPLCPVCRQMHLHQDVAMRATSRKDPDLEICDECARKEALEEGVKGFTHSGLVVDEAAHWLNEGGADVDLRCADHGAMLPCTICQAHPMVTK